MAKSKETGSSVSLSSRIPSALKNKNRFYRIFYGSYVLLPLLAILVWCLGLLLLMILWVRAGSPRYTSTEQDVPFISDLGAAHEALFLTICCLVDVFYFFSVCVIKWFRQRGRLPENTSRKERVCSWLAIIFCFIGCAGLFMLAKWNDRTYSKVHWIGTVVFILGVGFSAVAQTLEVWFMRKEHPDRQHLQRNSYFKLACVAGDIIIAIAFGSLYAYCDGSTAPIHGHTYSQCDKMTSNASYLEWTIAFGLNAYFFTLAMDLWPSGKSSPRYLAKVQQWERMNSTTSPASGTEIGAEAGADFTRRGNVTKFAEQI
ncbi:hypothetical protein IAR55_004744 [Kwoniella newhampshirensis]|uniref:CWH43-like N-terminal domain-containing protein n=1 Tax=Kwoniella newhampshirensis TaxID=1651941 RepID=A0AAW0YWJ9_9TREE